MNPHPSPSMPVELMDTSAMNQPIPASQRMYQQSGNEVLQELPAPANDKINNRSETETFGRSHHPTSEIKSDVFPTAVGSDAYPTAMGSDAYPTVVGSDVYPPPVGSDLFPTPVSSPVPMSHTPGPQYSMEQGGYYPADQKTVPGVAYYQPTGMPGMMNQPTGTPGMMNQTHDLENPAVGHPGVVSIAQKPPRKMVNCCGRQVTQKTVIILSTVAALIIIVVIGLGAGLGARAARNRQCYYSYYYC